jgi:hypothetical protein
MHLDQEGLEQQGHKEQRGCKGQLVLLEAQAQRALLVELDCRAQQEQRELLAVKAALVQRDFLVQQEPREQLV